MSASRRPSVLFLAPSASLWGGVQTWLDQTVGYLRAEGWRVLVGLPRGVRFHDPVAYAAAHPGLDVVEMACFTGTREGRAHAVHKTLEKVRPDVLAVLNVGDALEGARRWKASSGGRGGRVAFTIHGFSAPQLAEVARYGGTIDRVVTTNRLMQRSVVDLCGIAGERVGYAPYGAEAPVGARPEGTAAGPMSMAWVGRVEEPQKRSSDLARVLLRCAEARIDFRCDVVGDGPEMASLRERLGLLVESGKVRLLGKRTREELYRDVYPFIDVLLLTSSWETGPIVAWEAMRHGAALVSTDYRGLAEEGALVHDANCLLAPVGDVEGLVGHVAALARDPSRRGRLGEAGRSLAESRYSIEASGGAWVREIDAALSARPLPPQPRPLIGARGRLERLVGASLAEGVRRVVGSRVRSEADSDEWPHATGTAETGAMRERLRERSLLFDVSRGNRA